MANTFLRQDPWHKSYTIVDVKEAQSWLKMTGLIIDPKLKQVVNRFRNEHPFLTENDLAQWLLFQALTTGDRLYLDLMRVFLDDTCYWTTRSLLTKYPSLRRTPLDTLATVRMVAVDIPKLLGRYDPSKGCSVEGYASMRLFSYALDEMRSYLSSYSRTSDWRLLRRPVHWLEKQLNQLGVGETQSERISQVVQAFQQCYSPTKGYKRLPDPTPEELSAIATFYNNQRSPEQPALNPIQVLKVLRDCANAVRSVARPQVISLDQSYDFIEHLEAKSSVSELSPVLWDIYAVVERALSFLSVQDQQLVFAYYSGTNQSQLSQQLGKPQYWLSRRLKKIRGQLIEAIASWCETQNIVLSSEQRTELEVALVEWLKDYCQQKIA